MNIINESILPAYNEYAAIRAEMAALQKKMDAAKAKIIEFHKANGEAKLIGNGFMSTLVEAKRITLLKDVIEEKFGALPPECMKTTSYETLKVTTVKPVNE